MSTHPLNSISHISPDALLTAMQNVTLSPSPGTDSPSSDNSPPPFRPSVSYTHAQILFLYKSPLVSPPRGMPLLKDWFGYAIPYILFLSSTYIILSEWNEQNASKKDSDSSAATSGARDKRCVPHEVAVYSCVVLTYLSFRRDQEDAGTFVIPFFHAPLYIHHLFSGAFPTRLLPVNVDSALANGKFQASIHSL
jgi:hypothetical protein